MTAAQGEKTAHRSVVVAVDGPAASGKSSICEHACQTQGWIHVSTGILYRAFGYYCMRHGENPKDHKNIAPVVDAFLASLDWKFREMKVAIDGEDLSGQLDSNVIGKYASQVAEIQVVRDKLKPLQRDVILQDRGVFLIDGRDIGTVIFPDADLKIFLNASLDVRAQRRFNQLQPNPSMQNSNAADLQAIRALIDKRDYFDSNRTVAPLRKSEGAIELITSDLSFEASVLALVNLVKKRLTDLHLS